MSDDEHGLLVTLQLLDERVEPRDDVEVRLSSRVAISEFVLTTQGELLGVVRLDLLVRHAVAHAGVNFVEVSKDAGGHLDPVPTVRVLDLRVLDVARRHDRSLQRARPKSTRSGFFGVGFDAQRPLAVFRQSCGVLLSHPRQHGVAADFSLKVVLALAVAAEVDGLVLGV